MRKAEAAEKGGASSRRSEAPIPRRSTSALTLVLAALVILLDQLSKWLIAAVVMQPPRVISLTSFFNLVLVRNRGVSFGMLRMDNAWGPWLLSVLAVAIVVWLFLWQRRARSRWIAFAVGLITGGALGNVIDRIVERSVTDFLDFHWGTVHWPAFNLADSAITIGVALILAEALFIKRESSKT